MANAHASDTSHYYVPHDSPWPIRGSVALFATMAGAVSFFNDWTDGHVAGHEPRSERGRGRAPSAPGLGIELNDEEVKKHLTAKDKTYFAPTPEWDDLRSHDRSYS